MPHWALRQTLIEAGAHLVSADDIERVERFSKPALEYEAARERAAIYPAQDRGLLEIAGRDRVDWLHNLLTNDIKSLSPGQGCYSFALDNRGRILMDFNVLADEEAFWIDLDRTLIPKALAHFDRYTFCEDLAFSDRSDQTVRFFLLGSQLQGWAEAIGAGAVLDQELLGITKITLDGVPVRAVRHDVAGLPAIDLHVPSEQAVACWRSLMKAGQAFGVRPIGSRTLRTLQIEAGIPVYGQDIDETVLPAETNQLERAVSFTKGCYIGQEIVARMKTHGSVARHMVGLRLRKAPSQLPSEKLLLAEGKAVGRLTSACDSPAVGDVIALGYLTTPWATPGQYVRVASDPPVEAEVVPLPFRAATAV